MYRNRLYYCCGVCRDDLGACRPIDTYFFKNKLSQTKIDIFSGHWGEFSFAKDQIPKDPLGFGLRKDQGTKTKPELALSQTPQYLISYNVALPLS